jgi:iron complex transport system permease protein
MSFARRPHSPGKVLALGVIAWGLACVLALKLGAVEGLESELILALRLPRVVLASAVGLGLAVAGAVLQSLFANPLCEPYTLGISSGATLGAVLGVTAGFELQSGGIAGSAFLGALLFGTILYGVGRRSGVGSLGLLLCGVMLGFVGSSLVALWMALADSSGVQGAILWLMGNLSRARIQGAGALLLGVLGVSLMIWGRWRDLDAFLLGEEEAASLGVEVGRARRRLLLAVSILIAFCVSASGMIGFIGLMVPHFARRWVGSLHFALLPAAGIWGAAALVAADTVARTAARPYEIPVGVITALFGAPLFLLLVLRRQRDSAAPVSSDGSVRWNG